jgi:hypothetical protein
MFPQSVQTHNLTARESISKREFGSRPGKDSEPVF